MSPSPVSGSTEVTPQASVFVLYTGGTIGMAPREAGRAGSPLVPKPLEELLAYVPAFSSVRIELGFAAFTQPRDSSDLGPDDWLRMAEYIEAVYDQYDGFVILHGTDTLSYTASALSFLFDNLAKPVVITGAQLPISDVRSDAVMNLVNSIYVAGYRATGLPCIPEVVVVFADRILRGCRTRKISTQSWAGFDSPNCPSLGHIGENIEIREHLLRPAPNPDRPFRVFRSLAAQVIDIALFPGFQASHLKRMVLDGPDTKAVLMRTYGAGNAPGADEFLSAIDSIINEHGRTILNVTQCLEGTVEMGLYQASSALLERGVISGMDMTPEAALAKLMWTLGNFPCEQIASRMQTSQRGEQSENLFDLRFGGSGSGGQPISTVTYSANIDTRFRPNRLSRATIRLTGVRFPGLSAGRSVQIRLRLVPTIDETTTRDDDNVLTELLLTEMALVWDGVLWQTNQSLDCALLRAWLTQSRSTLTLLCDSSETLTFQSLSLALFARADW
ncbi:MAG: asparaginase [Planctomycetota bacterium]